MMDLSRWRHFERHPLSEIFPDMEESTFASLCMSIRTGFDNKQQVLMLDGQVLDGWNRLRACVIENKTPTFDTYKGTDPVGEVVRRNLTRRHLEPGQRAMVAARLATYSHGGDRKLADDKTRKNDGKSATDQAASLPLEKSQAQAAKELNVSERSVRDAAKVIEKGSAQLQEAVADGTIAPSDGAKIVEQPKRVQNRAVQDVRNDEAPTARAAVQNRNPGMSDREKADARINRQHPASTATSSDTVTCPMCKGKGHVSAKQAAAAKFITPTLEEVTAYCHERKNDVDPEQWMDHYTSNGWKVGKSKMVDWKAAVRTWEKSEFSGNGKGKKEDPIGTAQRWAEKGGKK